MNRDAYPVGHPRRTRIASLLFDPNAQPEPMIDTRYLRHATGKATEDDLEGIARDQATIAELQSLASGLKGLPLTDADQRAADAAHSLVIETRHTEVTEWWMVIAKDCEISIESRPHYCDRGRFIAKIHPRGVGIVIDDQDGWPRYYFDWDRMLFELEAFLDCRGQL